MKYQVRNEQTRKLIQSALVGRISADELALQLAGETSLSYEHFPLPVIDFLIWVYTYLQHEPSAPRQYVRLLPRQGALYRVEDIRFEAGGQQPIPLPGAYPYADNNPLVYRFIFDPSRDYERAKQEYDEPNFREWLHVYHNLPDDLYRYRSTIRRNLIEMATRTGKTCPNLPL